MKIDLKILDKNLLTLIHRIGQCADQENISAYLVGGIVRDSLLKRKSFDIDIVVERESLHLAKIVSNRLKTELTVHDQFKTATMYYQNLRIDFARSRREAYPHPGSLPVVSEGGLVEDLQRRDFTINAIAMCVNADNLGEIIDPFLGAADLKKGLVRILHDQSFKDDATRILRAVRLEQRFDFKIETETLKFLKLALKDSYDGFIKPQRYFNEFKKILKEKDPLKPLGRLNELKGFEFLSKQFSYQPKNLASVYRFLSQYDDEFGTISRWFVYFLALIKDQKASEVERILQKFSFKKEEKKAILEGLRLADLRKNLNQRNIKRSKVFNLLSAVPLEMIVCWFATEKSLKVKNILKRYLSKDSKVKLSINGDDLRKLGVVEGQKVGEVLNQILGLKIDGKAKSKQDELRLAKKNIS